MSKTPAKEPTDQDGTHGLAQPDPDAAPASTPVETDKPTEVTPPATAVARVGRTACLPHLAARIFGVPLAVMPAKLQTMLTIVGPRFLGLDMGPVDSATSSHDKPPSIDGIAIIPVVGTLVKRAMPGDSTSDLTYDEIQASFLSSLNDPSISAIILDIDSPGGEVNGMLDLADAIFQARGTKPIVAVANELAASAAYAIASAADSVLIPRTGMVGSVGVLAVHMDMSGFDAKEGFKFTTIAAGARKTDGDPHAPLSPDAQAVIKAEVDRIYSLFTETVARNRKMSVDAVRKTEAGLFSGEQAVAVGFADDIGTISSALTGLLRERAQAVRATQDRQDIQAVVKGVQDRFIQIAKLCQLAGHPDSIVRFLEQGFTTEQAGAELLRLRTQKEEQVITSHILPTTTATRRPAFDTAAVYGRLRGASQRRI
jgi:signal peptide peptidase SppA